MAIDRQVALGEGQPLATGDTELQLDEIEPEEKADAGLRKAG